MQRHDWSVEEIGDLFGLPFNDLLFQAQTIHRRHFDANQVQVSTLLSIKTGACPEDCGYCSQSASSDTTLEREKLLPLDEVISAAVSLPYFTLLPPSASSSTRSTRRGAPARGPPRSARASAPCPRGPRDSRSR